MKKALLILFSTMFLSLTAQVTIDLQPIPAEGYGDLEDPYNRKDVKAGSFIANTSNSAKTFRWELSIESQMEPWAFAVCDINTCYDAAVTTETFTLGGGEGSILDVHLYPSGSLSTVEGAVPGLGQATVKVTEINNEANTITGIYNFEVVGPAIPSSLSELELSALKLFPNPTADFFEVRGPEGVQSLEIYNLLGSSIEIFSFRQGAQYSISNYAKGLYLVALKDENGQLLKTLRLQKL